MNFNIFSLAAFFSAALLLASALSIPAEPAHAFTSAPSVTTGDCTSAWSNSPASRTCHLNNTWVEHNKCNFFATCKYQITTGDNRGDASVTGVSKGDVGNLHHCGRLVLKVGSC